MSRDFKIIDKLNKVMTINRMKSIIGVVENE